MHKLMLGALAAATIALTVPAAAQGVYVGSGRGDGVAVRIGPGHPGYVARGERCRTVTTRITRPNGTVVTKRERRCRD
jgi:hypothetical protein